MGLWQVNATTGVATTIPVQGGPGIIGGDGLEIDGTTLYNVRGSGPNQVAVVLLRQSGTGWTAKWAGARSDETLDVPSTATLAGGWLWVINARFGVRRPPERAVLDLPAPGEVAGSALGSVEGDVGGAASREIVDGEAVAAVSLDVPEVQPAPRLATAARRGSG